MGDETESQKRFHAALALADIPDYPAAKAQLDLALQADANFDLSYLEVGLLYERMGHCEDAKTAFDRALELDLTSEDARYHLAQIFALEKDIKRTAEVLKPLIEEKKGLGKQDIILEYIKKLQDEERNGMRTTCFQPSTGHIPKI